MGIAKAFLMGKYILKVLFLLAEMYILCKIKCSIYA